MAGRARHDQCRTLVGSAIGMAAASVKRHDARHDGGQQSAPWRPAASKWMRFPWAAAASAHAVICAGLPVRPHRRHASMPIESPELQSARAHLARAEATLGSRDGLFHLEEGLALLDDIIAADEPRSSVVAKNVAATYATRMYRRVGALLESDRGLPEPELEHLFKVVLAFDQGSFDLPAKARDTKIGIARRLLDRYYEGHPAEEKQKALEQLAGIAGEQAPAARPRRAPKKK
jgi:hypothetical protein